MGSMREAFQKRRTKRKKTNFNYHAFGGAQITDPDVHDILYILWRWKNGFFNG